GPIVEHRALVEPGTALGAEPDGEQGEHAKDRCGQSHRQQHLDHAPRLRLSYGESNTRAARWHAGERCARGIAFGKYATDRASRAGCPLTDRPNRSRRLATGMTSVITFLSDYGRDDDF